jgi:hypothetical protein
MVGGNFGAREKPPQTRLVLAIAAGCVYPAGMKVIAAQSTGPSEMPSAETADPLALERRAFLRHRRQLLRRYPGEYVALHGGQVVGHDRDDEALAARMFTQLGNEPFYIVRVEKMPAIYDLPSPEVEL